jgi:hypothetical protein
MCDLHQQHVVHALQATRSCTSWQRLQQWAQTPCPRHCFLRWCVLSSDGTSPPVAQGFTSFSACRMHTCLRGSTIGRHIIVALLQVRKFRDRLDAELPGLYTWFDDSSLHVTLRALT